MAITPIGGAAPTAVQPVYGATPNPSLTTPNPYAPPGTAPNNMFGAGNNLAQEIVGGPAKSNAYSNTTTTKAPYAPLIGPINQYLTGTEQLYGGGAPQISPAEQAGYTALGGAATGPQANYGATAANSGASIAGGSLLDINSNPYLQSIIGETGSQALQDVNKTFGGAGRTGSGLNEWYGGQGVAQAENTLLSNEYGTNVGATMNAIQAAPQSVTSSLAIPEALISAGTAQSMRPYELNQNLGGILTQLAGLGGTTNTQMQSEATAMAQSGGILGQIMNNLVFGPQGQG